jgi:IPTL-CTERM motif
MGEQIMMMKKKNSTPLPSINPLSRLALRAALSAALVAGLTLVSAPKAHAAVQLCTEAGLDTALAAGGTNTFSCGAATTIAVSATKTVSVSGTVLDGSGLLTISGGSARRVFTVNAGVTVTFQNLTIVNGNSGGAGGGGIFNNGTVTISNSTLSGNSGNGGGGIFNGGAATVTISNSTFSGNSSTGGSGGGIYNNGTATISNSTFSGNSTPANGGGINSDGGTVTISNSTFSGNSATTGGGIFRNGGTVTLRNTIVANSTSGGNCSGTITDGGNNLDSASTCGFATNAKNNTNPNLGALTGSPAYFPLSTGSAAIDAGDNTICAAVPVSNASQNGVTRPTDGDGNGTATCDIGSYEAPAFNAGVTAVPTLSEWAMLLLAVMLAMFGMKGMARRRHLEP